MQTFTWVEIAEEQTPAANGTLNFEIGTRPKAGIALRISALNAAAQCTMAQLLGSIEDVQIRLFGSAFVQLNGVDLAALNAFWLGRGIIQENVDDTDNATRSLVLYIPFGKGLCDPNYGLWQTRPDEASLSIQFDIADTGYDGLIINAAALELPDAQYRQCLRYNTITHTPTGTGNSDADLPRVHPTLAYLLFSTTVHTGTAWTTTADQVTLLEDRNPEKLLGIHWELLHGLSDLYAKDWGQYNAKIHVENTAASYAQNADTAAEQQIDNFLENYAYIDMCPDGNLLDPYDPSVFSDLKMRLNAGDTNPARIIPLELFTPRLAG